MRHLPKPVVSLLVALSAVGLLAGSATAATPRTIPRPALFAPTDLVAGALGSLVNPMRSPAGTNDFTCRPSAAHPNPVVLVHGTFGNAYDSWSGLGPVLRYHGYCVFAVNYGAPSWSVFKATGDIPTSAAEIGRFVERVRTATGAAE
ncbi:MAG TPA: hypothetical protein VHK88_00620, partial [Aquihabitans sp.]|nr:hypothetical protein [Aquihabitans sp.]